MSKVKDVLKDYTAPLEDNYGKKTYDMVLDTLVLKLPAAILEDCKFVWKISWTRDGSTVSTLFGSNNTQEDMERACEKIAMSPWKRPVVLEAIVERKVWE